MQSLQISFRSNVSKTLETEVKAPKCMKPIVNHVDLTFSYHHPNSMGLCSEFTWNGMSLYHQFSKCNQYNVFSDAIHLGVS